MLLALLQKKDISYSAQNEILYVVQRQFEYWVHVTSLISISADNFVRGDEFGRNHGAKEQRLRDVAYLFEYPSNVRVNSIPRKAPVPAQKAAKLEHGSNLEHA